MNLYTIPGLRYVGDVVHNQVNNGQAVPLFRPEAPTDRPSINTREGWNALAEKQNRRAFSQAFGRQPACDDELKAWQNSGFASEFVWVSNQHDRKDFAEI